MIVLVPLLLGLSPGLVFPLNVENDESVEPTAGTWVVAIFERRFCGILPVDGGEDKSDELASGLVMAGAAASSAEECGPRVRLSRDTPGLASLRAPTGFILVFSLGCSGISSSLGVFSSGTDTLSRELVGAGDSVFSGNFLKGSLGESAMLLCGAGRVLLTATEVRGAETVLYVTNDDLLERALDNNDCREIPLGIEGFGFSSFGLGFTIKLEGTGSGSQTGGGGGSGRGLSSCRSSRALSSAG